MEETVPESFLDWPIVAGDVAEIFDDVERTPSLLRQRWAEGSTSCGPIGRTPYRSAARHAALVRMCREIDVLTPEDAYAVWQGDGGPIPVASLFRLYDYSWPPADRGVRAFRPGTAGPEVGEHRARPEPQGHRVLNYTPSWRGNE
ncbi:hypothetical protein AB0N31_04650 [Streptomyces sp. NPDC051051]|uniref:hypothetical protein n=1 Tax=Streptomyces sp. NPDC051051 TaxID=3155666 RepID=UPI00344432EC